MDATPWQAGRPIGAQLAERCSVIEVSTDVGRFDGVFTVLHLRSNGSGWVTADPLGLAMLYRAETAEVDVISNRADLAAALAGAAGRPSGRDVEAMGLLGYTGTLIGDRTGFEGVRVLPQASIVHLTSGRAPSVETWADLPWWSGGEQEDPATGIDRCLDRLRARVRLLVATEDRVTCELTGGKDSRLVLALLLAEGVANDVQYVTWGGPDLPDVKIATILGDHFGLDHRTEDRPSPRPIKPSPTDPAAWVRPNWMVRSVGYEERLRHHCWATSGSLSFWDLHTVLWPPAQGPSLCGLAGEVLSTNYPATNGVGSFERLQSFLAGRGLGYNSAGLLTAGAAEHLAGIVEAELLSLVPRDGDARDAVDGFYQRGRLRRWAGLKFEIGSRNRAFPLYDLQVARAAFSIGSEARRREELHFGLMRACAPELTRMPFAGKGWSRDLVAAHPHDGLGEPAPRVSPTPSSIGNAPRPQPGSKDGHVANPAPGRRRWRGSAPAEPRMGTTSAEANRMRNFDEKREVLRSMLDLPSGHPVWDLYERDRTLDALDTIETLPKRGRAEVHHAATAACWLDHGEQRSDLFIRST